MFTKIIPASFISSRYKLSWPDVLVGLECGWIMKEDFAKNIDSFRGLINGDILKKSSIMKNHIYRYYMKIFPKANFLLKISVFNG